jgi:hypothetical protein
MRLIKFMVSGSLLKAVYQDKIVGYEFDIFCTNSPMIRILIQGSPDITFHCHTKDEGKLGKVVEDINELVTGYSVDPVVIVDVESVRLGSPTVS